MLTLGIDSGSVATKAVLYDGIHILGAIQVPTGWSPKESAEEAVAVLQEKHGVADRIVGTGYGRVTMAFAHRAVTEITCHGKGISVLNPEIRAVIDIGGQDSKVIALDGQGSISEFLMNDKCAAGTGRFLQNTLVQLGEDITKLDQLAEDHTPIKISSMCTVFAESEIVSMLAKGVEKGSIAAGLVESVSERAVTLFSRIDPAGAVAFTGGVSRSKAMQSALERRLGRPVYCPKMSPFMGAIGAAIIGWGDVSEEAPRMLDTLPEHRYGF